MLPETVLNVKKNKLDVLLKQIDRPEYILEKYIQGKEYNPQIDEAYLLLGQSRYFDLLDLGSEPWPNWIGVNKRLIELI